MQAFFYVYLVSSAVVSNSADVEEMIGQIKKRLDITTLMCSYSVVADDLGGTRTFSFAMDGDNFYMGVTEGATATYSPRGIEALQLMSKTQEQSLNLPRDTQWDYFRVKGVWTLRLEALQSTPQEREVVGGSQGDGVHFFYHGEWPSPLTLLGALNNGACDQSSDTREMWIKEFLDTPGPFLVFEKTGYTVLAHEITFENGGQEDRFGLDIWVNDKGDIARIERTYRAWDVPDDIRRKWTDAPLQDTKYVVVEVTMEEYADGPNGVRFPTMATFAHFKFDMTQYSHVARENKEMGLASDEAWLRLFLLPHSEVFTRHIAIDKNSLIINEPLDPTIFIPLFPDGSRIFTNRDLSQSFVAGAPAIQASWYVRYAVLIFSVVCIFVVTALALATRRWLGWGK